MSSILKVDQLQDSGGNALITSDGSGNVNTNIISHFSQWRLTSDYTTTATTNTLLPDWTQVSTFGTGVMTNSSGTWSFPSTGVYEIRVHGLFLDTGSSRFAGIRIYKTTDNSTYTACSTQYGNMNRVSSTWFTSCVTPAVFDVTDITLCKVQINAYTETAATVDAATTDLRTQVFFKKIMET